MIYLAESGSTKCDSVFLTDDGKEVTRMSTMGFNPYFHSSDFINQKLSEEKTVQDLSQEVKQVFFYGAGCSTPAMNKIVSDGLEKTFPNAVVKVDHDLMACAYATYTGEPAISCILGTGSNSVFFDGTNIREEVPALAYILGDEGSAGYIGKQLLSSFLYRKMPAEALLDFEKTFALTKDDIIQNVYSKPHANVYLASFAPFAYKHIQHPFFWEVVFKGFKKFLEIHVLCYPEARKVPVHFVGSIAFHFSDILDEALQHLKLKKGNIIQKPVRGLIDYHKRFLIDHATSSSENFNSGGSN